MEVVIDKVLKLFHIHIVQSYGLKIEKEKSDKELNINKANCLLTLNLQYGLDYYFELIL